MYTYTNTQAINRAYIPFRFLAQWSSLSSYIFIRISKISHLLTFCHRHHQLSPQFARTASAILRNIYSWEPRAVSAAYIARQAGGETLRMDNSAAAFFQAQMDCDSAFAYMCWVQSEWPIVASPLAPPTAAPSSTSDAHTLVPWSPPTGLVLASPGYK